MAIYEITFAEKYRRAGVHNHGCNFRCRGCTYRLKSDPPPERFLPVEEIHECLRQLEPEAVHFIGGEPTTNPQLPELLAFCKQQLGVTTRLGHTNGSGLITKDLDGTNVSFKAFDEDVHLAYTGRLVAPAIENFRRSYEAGVEMRASTVLIPDLGGVEQVEKVAAFVGGVDRNIPFHIVGYIPVPGAPWRRPTEDEMHQGVAAARRYLDHVTFSHLTTDQAKDLTQCYERSGVQRVR